MTLIWCTIWLCSCATNYSVLLQIFLSNFAVNWLLTERSRSHNARWWQTQRYTFWVFDAIFQLLGPLILVHWLVSFFSDVYHVFDLEQKLFQENQRLPKRQRISKCSLITFSSFVVSYCFSLCHGCWVIDAKFNGLVLGLIKLFSFSCISVSWPWQCKRYSNCSQCYNPWLKHPGLATYILIRCTT